MVIAEMLVHSWKRALGTQYYRSVVHEKGNIIAFSYLVFGHTQQFVCWTVRHGHVPMRILPIFED